MQLVAIMMDDVETARNARMECAKLAQEHLLTLEDAVVVYKEEGEVKLDQAVNLTAAGAMGGAWWGVLIGAIAGVATGGAGLALAGLAGGAAGGALSGWMSDAGISDELMKQTADALEGGKAILFIAGRTGAPDKVLERLKPFGGEVVTSNLTADADKKINAILSGESA
ncbi:DUF1269 domain-containing protein [uncultured Pelagimonas sp.]|uniref:DUF1269 domain-containing protein n=1 Tax=uncultured Pelagimonas sp. TaxID=1618102 RepID=UPI00263016A2|nr:DUF1269 domain-containing protein [uncultured Pelagimonas sp.]